MAADRPPLGFEYEIALAKVDTTQTLTFAETTYPAIVGSFDTVSCTREIRCVPPVDQFKPLACGYNPAAMIIPAPSLPGTLAFEANDKPLDVLAETYGGYLCVARLKAVLEYTDTDRTWYCSYWTPRFEVRTPDGEGEGRIVAEGLFTLLSTA